MINLRNSSDTHACLCSRQFLLTDRRLACLAQTLAWRMKMKEFWLSVPILPALGGGTLSVAAMVVGVARRVAGSQGRSAQEMVFGSR